jgi:ADP-heptose:LPS heptosyltransferase
MARSIGRGIGSERHVADRYLSTLEGIGIPVCVRYPSIDLHPDEVKRAAEFLKGRGVRDPGRFAALAPGAKWPGKEWTRQGFTELAGLLSERKGLQTVIVGDAADTPVAGEIVSAATGPAVDITGRTDLRRLAAVLSLAQVCVGNDSGPGHMSAAVNTATVVLFGPTSEAFGFTPLGRFVRTVSLPLACRPCSIHGEGVCSEAKRRCLDDIDAETVYAAAASIIEERKKASAEGKVETTS